MKTLRVLSNIDDHDQNKFRQERLETPFVHAHQTSGVNNHYTDSVDVGDTLEGFYRNNDEEVDRIYNIPFSLTHENNYYCIPGIACQGIQTFKACQCLCQRRKPTARIYVATFVLLLCCLVLGNQLFNTVAWNVSTVESSQLKHLKSHVNSVSEFTGLESNGMDGHGLSVNQLSPKNLSFGSINYVGDESISAQPTNSSA